MENKSDVPAKRLMKSITSGELKEMGSDAAEALLDAKLDDGVFKDLPVVGWVFKSVSIFNKTQDYFFAKKLYKFLFALKDISASEREAFREKLEASGKD